MKALIFLALFGIALSITTTPAVAYKVLQDEITTLNNEASANAKMLNSIKGTLKKVMQELHDTKLMQRMIPSASSATSDQQALALSSALREKDRQRLQNISAMMKEIDVMKEQLSKAKPIQQHEPQAPKTNEMKAMDELNKKIAETNKVMNKEEVQKESEMTEAQLRAEMKKYDTELEKLDRFAQIKINKHRRKNPHKSLEEKNLNRRRNYIKTREQQLLEQLNKKEMELFSASPSFQGTMKDSLKLIFKNEDKQRTEARTAPKPANGANQKDEGKSINVVENNAEVQPEIKPEIQPEMKDTELVDPEVKSDEKVKNETDEVKQNEVINEEGKEGKEGTDGNVETKTDTQQKPGSEEKVEVFLAE